MNEAVRKTAYLAMAATFGLALTTGMAAAAELTLVRDGHAAAAIVLAAAPSRAAQLAAFELQHHLQLITGATLPILSQDAAVAAAAGGVLIYVGDTAAARAAGLPQDRFAAQEYAVRFAGKAIFLVGRDAADQGPVTYAPATESYGGLPSYWTEQGTLHAAYDFLEQFCGVRWLAATRFGTVVPHSPTLAVTPRDIRRQPAFAYRDGLAAVGDNLANYDELVGYWPGYYWQPGGSNELRAWQAAAHADLRERYPDQARFDAARTQRANLHLLRRRNGGSIQRCNHSLNGYYQRFWDDPKTRRPEFFAKGYEGKPPQLCYTNRALIKQVAADARAYYDTGKADGIFWNPRPPNWFPVEPMDNQSFCRCEACQALLATDPNTGAHYSTGEHSDYFFNFVNEVAKELRRTHPDKSVVTLAYMSHARPPAKIKLDPSVAVAFCQSTNRWGPANPSYAYEMDLLRQWAQDGSGRPLYMWLYDTFPLETARNRNLNCWPGVFSQVLASQMQRYRELGVKGFFHCGFAQDVDAYLTFKYMNDPSCNVDTLLDEYFTGLYGAAAAPIKEFYRRVEERYIRFGDGLSDQPEAQYTEARMSELGALVEKAGTLVNTAREKANLELFKLGIWAYMQEGMVQRRRIASAPIPTLGVPRVAAAGGDVAKVDWAKAAALRNWHQHNSVAASARALSGRIAHDGKYLYLELVDVCDPAKLTSVGLIFPFDTWEVFVAAQRGLPLRQYALNPAGTKTGLSHGEVNFRMNVPLDKVPLTVASDTSAADRWVVRLAWPLDQIVGGGLKPGVPFYLNVVRVWKHPGGVDIWGPLSRIGAMERAPQLTLE